MTGKNVFFTNPFPTPPSATATLGHSVAVQALYDTDITPDQLEFTQRTFGGCTES